MPYKTDVFGPSNRALWHYRTGLFSPKKPCAQGGAEDLLPLGRDTRMHVCVCAMCMCVCYMYRAHVYAYTVRV